ncbi:MAG: efflux RND transporter periplasmic adaptor subunit [Chthoniobacterales bacterium]
MKMFILIATVAAILFALLAVLFFRSKRAIPGSLFAVFALLFVFADIKASQFNKMASMKPPVPVETVSSAVAKEEDWPEMFASVGSVSPVQGAVVAAEQGGTVSEVAFQSGAEAKKGDLLMKLDTSAEAAQLKTAEADLELARADFERAKDLQARQVTSKADFDAADSKVKQKQGIVDNMRSLIAKKEVHAPFDGSLGIRLVNVGQMINPGQQLVSLQSIDPVYVDFALPQQSLPKLTPGLAIQVVIDALPEEKFEGKLTAINSAVDIATRNVTLQATLENPKRILHPGMFVKVNVVLPAKNKSLVIPGTAVSYAPYGDSVYVIEKKKDEKTGKETQTLRQAFVRVGEARGDFVSITEGLKAGDTVVSTGVFKLRNGMAVTINNDLAPKPELNPKPADT